MRATVVVMTTSATPTFPLAAALRAGGFVGRLVEPADADYASARAGWNGARVSSPGRSWSARPRTPANNAVEVSECHFSDATCRAPTGSLTGSRGSAALTVI
jgi:hypothetical protein